ITADTTLTPNEGVTAGSHSMQDSGTAILNACANVRALLAEAAATQLSLAPAQVTTTGDGRMTAGGRSATYGELASMLSLHVQARPDMPRRPGPHKQIGRDLPRVDIPAKLTGGGAYVHDLRLPGMLHARVARGPSDGTALDVSTVAAQVEAMPGVVRLVRNGGFCAVVAEREWTAIQALQRLQTGSWRRTAPALPADGLAAIRNGAGQDLTIAQSAVTTTAAKRVQARYTRPWLMHGAIGPSCAVARLDQGQLTVWTHSQGVAPLQKSISELVRLPLDKVRCIHMEGSGCYGHNGADDVAGDAALCAMALPGRPVRLQWTREQEHGWEPLGSGMVVDISAGLGASGRIVSWDYEVWSNPHNGRPTTAGGLLAGLEVSPAFPHQTPRPIPMPEGGGDRNAIPLYAVGGGRTVFHFRPGSPLRVSALRSLGGFMNTFAIENFMDELALATGGDPVDFRLAHLSDPRAQAVIRACADAFGWASRPKGPGRACGFAFARYKNLAAYCAVAMEVEVERETGRVRVHHVNACVDAGEAVNPDGIRNQIEGAIVQAISWTGHEAVTFDSTRRTGFDWSAYPILRFKDAPARVAVQVLDQPGQPFLGAGEAGQGPAGAAYANAISAATGRRIRELPLTAQRISAAVGN
ncbi:MAG TPA: molybdopterin cofactor-binding domain-containing protein, partial [Caulobacteraceae bacterium]|nr:molybdopterin cofactor-binding domain-containing protein [Caulobacteraceae bacterium]